MTDSQDNKIQKGDIIHLDYELWITDDEILFDTTSKELAEKHEISNENTIYQPQALIVDEGKSVAGLYNSLLKAEVGQDYEIEIPPEEGLGQRDPKLVEWHRTQEIERQKLEPVVGKEITVKDKSGRERTGTVIMVTPRRTRVDYNNPLAGKTLKYKYKVIDKASQTQEKVSTILEMDFGRKDEFEITIEDDAADIKLPDVCKYDQMWLIAKYKVVNDLREYAGLSKIRFIEEYVKKEEEEKEEEEKGGEEVPEKQKEASEEETHETKEETVESPAEDKVEELPSEDRAEDKTSEVKEEEKVEEVTSEEKGEEQKKEDEEI
jgi:FKBP-type peptidyl-prolyl cis-trans isomerase 2